MQTLNELQKILSHVTRPDGGTFYRSLYHMKEADSSLSITTLEEWRALPLITKDILIAAPLSARSFIPLPLLDHLRTSSGTSGKPPLFSPRTTLRGMEYRMQYHSFSNGILAYGVPAMPHWHEQFQKDHGQLPRVIVYDPKNPKASVRLANVLGVDSISTFAFHIRSIGEAMIQEGIHERIRFIEICGEACTTALFEYISHTFPNAILIPFYGSSEVEDSPMGVPCRPITGEEPLSIYHAKGSQYHELIDPSTGENIEPIAGAEGELVVSAFPGEPSAFPLIRFRTGDTARVVETRCPIHNTWSFTLVGRTDLDAVKIPGGVIKAHEIERVLRLMKGRISDTFTLHCYTKQTAQGPLFEPVLAIQPLNKSVAQDFADEIAAKLLVAPEYTYAMGVSSGKYLPLRCIEIEPTTETKKHVRIVRHS